MNVRSGRGNSTHEYLACALLFLISFLLYSSSINFDFIPTWDDADYVLNNTAIRGLSLQHLKHIFFSSFLGNYAPLHILSYTADYLLWGLDPRGYHLSNVLLHALNACLAFLLIKKVTGQFLPALLAAMLFSFHPLNVENVAWVSERKTLLSSFFFLLCLILYLRFREKPDGAVRVYLASLFLYVCAVLSKTSVVTLPLILGIYEWLFRKEGRRWLPIIPFLVFAIAGSALGVVAHAHSKSFEKGVFSPDILFGVVYPTMVPIFWIYIGKLLAPLNLSGYYDAAIHTSFLEPTVLISLISWITLSFFVLRRGNSQVRFWFLWFWCCLLPMSNIVPLPVYYADRYMYGSAIGFFVLIGLAIAALGRRLFTRTSTLKTAAAAILIASVFYAALSLNRLPAWSHELAFWDDTVSKSPNLYKPHLNLGVVYEKMGRMKEAEQEYERAVAIYPGQEAIINLRVLQERMKLTSH